jgi:hypothetical protein
MHVERTWEKMDTAAHFGVAYFFAIVLLLLSYGYEFWYLGGIGYATFFQEMHMKTIKSDRCCLPRVRWVLIGAAAAFLCNMVFAGYVAFHSTAWDASKLDAQHAVLVMQIVYYVLQIGYIRGLKLKLLPYKMQWLLGVCGVLQVASAILAFVYGVGPARYLNVYPALWTFLFDFITHTLWNGQSFAMSLLPPIPKATASHF